jgi:hypothetical protein
MNVINTAGPCPESQEGIDMPIATNYFIKWPEVYTIPNQAVLMVAQILATSFF